MEAMYMDQGAGNKKGCIAHDLTCMFYEQKKEVQLQFELKYLRHRQPLTRNWNTIKIKLSSHYPQNESCKFVC